MEELMNLKFTSEWWALIAPLILCVLDVLTGYIYAWINNDVKSYKMREGLGKKFGELVYVVLGIVAKYAIRNKYNYVVYDVLYMFYGDCVVV